MDALTETERFLALQLLQADAVKFGAFRLKLHEEHPDAPLSPIFFNLRTTDNPKPGPLTPQIVHTAGQMFYDRASQLHLAYDHVAGVPNAGDPFAKAFAQCSPDHPNILRLGKEGGAEHRRIKGVHGRYRRGEEVLLLDDVITKAGSKLEAIRELYEANLCVHHILVLVDREQGGDEELKKKGCKVHAIFKLSQLLDFYLEEKYINRDKYDEVMAYLAANR